MRRVATVYAVLAVWNGWLSPLFCGRAGLLFVGAQLVDNMGLDFIKDIMEDVPFHASDEVSRVACTCGCCEVEAVLADQRRCNLKPVLVGGTCGEECTLQMTPVSPKMQVLTTTKVALTQNFCRAECHPAGGADGDNCTLPNSVGPLLPDETKDPQGPAAMGGAATSVMPGAVSSSPATNANSNIAATTPAAGPGGAPAPAAYANAAWKVQQHVDGVTVKVTPHAGYSKAFGDLAQKTVQDFDPKTTAAAYAKAAAGPGPAPAPAAAPASASFLTEPALEAAVATAAQQTTTAAATRRSDFQRSLRTPG